MAPRIVKIAIEISLTIIARSEICRAVPASLASSTKTPRLNVAVREIYRLSPESDLSIVLQLSSSRHSQASDRGRLKSLARARPSESSPSANAVDERVEPSPRSFTRSIHAGVSKPGRIPRIKAAARIYKSPSVRVRGCA